jgi:DNA-binding response OmpR family regulator
MRANVLIVGKSSELRLYISHALGNAGWETLIFSDGRSAFLYTCRHLTTVAAAVVDESLGVDEAALCARQLNLLRPDIPIVLIGEGHGIGRVWSFDAASVRVIQPGVGRDFRFEHWPEFGIEVIEPSRASTST